jgi:hypothetical protein
MMASDALAAAQATKVSPKDNPPMDRQARVPGGDILLNQQPNAVNGFFNDSDCQLCPTGQQSIADNFVVNSPAGSVTLNQITTWGGYFPGNTPNATDDFDILIHNNAGGLPGPTIVFSVLNIPATTRATTGVILFGVDEYIFDFILAAPPSLPNGTYWLEIFNNTAPTPGVDFFWETGNLDGTNGVLNAAFAQQTPGTAWLSNPGENAVVLTGVIPVTLQDFSIQ